MVLHPSKMAFLSIVVHFCKHLFYEHRPAVQITASEMHVAPQIFSSTFVHFHPLSFAFTLFFHPLLSTTSFTHFFQPLITSTFINFQLWDIFCTVFWGIFRTFLEHFCGTFLGYFFRYTFFGTLLGTLFGTLFYTSFYTFLWPFRWWWRWWWCNVDDIDNKSSLSSWQLISRRVPRVAGPTISCQGDFFFLQPYKRIVQMWPAWLCIWNVKILKKHKNTVQPLLPTSCSLPTNKIRCHFNFKDS